MTCPPGFSSPTEMKLPTSSLILISMSCCWCVQSCERNRWGPLSEFTSHCVMKFVCITRGRFSMKTRGFRSELVLANLGYVMSMWIEGRREQGDASRVKSLWLQKSERTKCKSKPQCRCGPFLGQRPWEEDPRLSQLQRWRAPYHCVSMCPNGSYRDSQTSRPQIWTKFGRSPRTPSRLSHPLLSSSSPQITTSSAGSAVQLCSQRNSIRQIKKQPSNSKHEGPEMHA